jgi:poly-gamma-glutamate capsule biosynthesis protein CapA/YwtB (metallophosphatase superfamily)
MSAARRWSKRVGYVAVTTVLLASPAWGQQPPQRPGAVGVSPGYNQSMNSTIADGFTLAAVGDLIINQPESNLQEPEFQAALEILRRADVAFGNFEGSAIDMRTFKGYPAAENGGAWLIDAPTVPADLARMGIDMVSRANNHATDWGVAGMQETDRWLSEAGLVYAGSGYDLSAAQAPHYLSTPEGRVALVSMASTFTPMSRAMDALRAAPGRPGIDALRTVRSVVVPPALFERLRRLGSAMDSAMPEAWRAQLPKSDSAKVVDLFGTRYEPGSHAGFSYTMNASDLKGILKAIRQGKENSDFVVATIHAHEPGNWSTEPPDFMPTLAHDAIDAGADAFIGHGPHQLHGIEIYKGKPIFYSLGNFFFQSSMPSPVGIDEYEAFHLNPDSTTDEEQNAVLDKQWFSGERWYQSVIAVSRFEHGRVAEIRLFPVVLGATLRAADRGIPRLAPPAEARTILERLQRLSAPFHTTIEIQGSVGIIHPSAGAGG